MVSCGLFIRGPLWIQLLSQICRCEELPREAVLSWLAERVLEGLGLEDAPQTTMRGPSGDTVLPQTRLASRWAPWASRPGRVNQRTTGNQETSEIILFPNSGKRLHDLSRQIKTPGFIWFLHPRVCACVCAFSHFLASALHQLLSEQGANEFSLANNGKDFYLRKQSI